MQSRKILLTVTLLLFSLVSVYAQYDSEDDFWVELSEDKKSVRITSYSGNKQNVSIPPKIQGLPVSEICDMAFNSCNFTSITIPDSVTEIGEGAFLHCENLTEINVDVKNKTYSSQDGVLYNKNKTILFIYPEGKEGSFVIPNSVQSIEVMAFYDCISLTSVTIPDSVTEIGEFAFAYSGLISATIPKSVQSIGEVAFSGCASLTELNVDVDNKEYTSQDGVLYDKNKTNLYQYPAGKKGPFVIPNSVLSIACYSFNRCADLTAVIIGNNVTEIGEGAFLNCDELKKVIIPNKVKTIGAYAFSSCESLTAVIIGSSVTEIGEEAFEYCAKLTKITIPKSVTKIGKDAFFGCRNIVSVRFEGVIPSDKFNDRAFLGDLRDKFYATDAVNGTPGTYTAAAPVDRNSVWTRR
jgi:hypothetical protein